MSSFKRSQQKHVKKAYRVRNWPEYEAGLRARGSLTVWLSLTDEGKLANWDAPVRKKKRGLQAKYSDHAIETSITLGMLLHLKLRWSSGPGEFHPQALTEPCVNLSIHTALPIRPYRTACQGRAVLPSSVDHVV